MESSHYVLNDGLLPPHAFKYWLQQKDLEKLPWSLTLELQLALVLVNVSTQVIIYDWRMVWHRHFRIDLGGMAWLYNKSKYQDKKCVDQRKYGGRNTSY